MRIAIVHDWLVTYAGAERVLEQMLICFPHADVFSMVDFLDDQQRGFCRASVPRLRLFRACHGPSPNTAVICL